jgi:uncharacterized membrane protein YhdT
MKSSSNWYKPLAKSPKIINNWFGDISIRNIILFILFIVLIMSIIYFNIKSNDDIEEFDTCSSCS